MRRKQRNTYVLEMANGQQETVRCDGSLQDQFTGMGAYALFAEFESSNGGTVIIGGNAIVTARLLE
ncbi:hypothetical protein [Arthrobacter castelli]|uniref:hypothetical protein n=1 Tax=Arthrobacter castelli TaxID=271431 RepID=UPI0003FF5CD4|nr:hypothetical protein [Arthrobacter castelli]